MIRRAPCEYFLKFLVSHPSNYSDETIQDRLFSLGLDDLGDAYLKRVKRQTIRPVPFKPLDKEHFPSQHFINKHRIYSLYFPDAAMKCAMTIADTPKLKEFVEALSLTGSPPSVIVQGAAFALPNAAPITVDGIRKFYHYFWNTDLLDFTEMRALIARRGASSKDGEYKKAFYKDSRKVACELPFSPLSAALAQIRLGITPRGVNFAELMERVCMVSGIKAYQAVLDDSIRSAENAKNYVTTAQVAMELMERSQKPEAKIVERFTSLNKTNDHRPIPTIGQLSGGLHTADLQPIEEKARLVEVDDEA